METEAKLVLCTVPSKASGMAIAREAVNLRLAACVNIIPGVTSVYRWQDKVETDSEQLLLIKTRNDLIEPLQNMILKHHPYELPEVIAVPIVGGSSAYLSWLYENTGA